MRVVTMNNTNFGFKNVSFEAKRNLVQDVFSKVASKYDLMNDLMSFGIHRLWKREFVSKILNLNSKILDVASGTGDIALKLLKKAKLQDAKLQITLCDINQDMLDIAGNKLIDNNFLANADYVCVSAENLPFEDNSFDYYTIAFGIRNVAQIENALKEAYRVLKQDGTFLCLEFSHVEHDYLRKLYDLYSFNVIPKIGELVAGSQDAYQYLVESINLFPDQDHFRVMIQDIGFRNVSYKNMTQGIVAIHSAKK